MEINIPEPCSEDWGNMQKTACGAFCHKCQKEVVDFTQKSDAEIIHFLQNRRGETCGRFTADMLNRQLIMQTPNHLNRWKKWAVAATLLLGLNVAKGAAADTSAKAVTVQTDASLKKSDLLSSDSIPVDTIVPIQLPIKVEEVTSIAGGVMVMTPREKMKIFFRRLKSKFYSRKKKFIYQGRF